MRWLTKASLAYTRKGLQLNDAEIEILKNASQLAERIRDEARRVVPEFENDDTDTFIAGIEHHARAIVDSEGFITVTETLNTDAPIFEMRS